MRKRTTTGIKGRRPVMKLKKDNTLTVRSLRNLNVRLLRRADLKPFKRSQAVIRLGVNQALKRAGLWKKLDREKVAEGLSKKDILYKSLDGAIALSALGSKTNPRGYINLSASLKPVLEGDYPAFEKALNSVMTDLSKHFVISFVNEKPCLVMAKKR